jgi:hypothetical protein
MNCKPGDRAIVYRYLLKEFEPNLGKICEIIEALDDSMWRVKTLGSFYLHDIKRGWCFFPTGYTAGILDEVLMPLSGDLGDEIKFVKKVVFK